MNLKSLKTCQKTCRYAYADHAACVTDLKVRKVRTDGVEKDFGYRDYPHLNTQPGFRIWSDIDRIQPLRQNWTRIRIF